MKTSNVQFMSMGNGITVYYSATNNIRKLAHINIHRQITYYSDLPKDIIQMIEDYSNSKNPSISHTQEDQFIFKNKV
jgi:hypothetical protein